MDSPAPHPLSLPYPLMGGPEFAAFKADVAANGQREPIRLFEGLILDGRHRERAARELGIEPRYEEFTGSAEEAKAAVDSWNLHRRHLTADFRRERVRGMKASGMSNRAIAAELKVGEATVRRDIKSGASDDAPAPSARPPIPTDRNACRQDLADLGYTDREVHSITGPADDPAPEPERPAPSPMPPPTPTPPKVTGLDGKKYPAAKPQRAAVRVTEPPPDPPPREPTVPANPPPGESSARRKSVGVFLANEACNVLLKIPRNDPERRRAFEIVAQFIDANQ